MSDQQESSAAVPAVQDTTNEVQQEEAKQEIKDEMLPAIGNTTEMTEYEKRLKRAQRFGIDPDSVVSKSSVNISKDQASNPEEVMQQMQKQGRQTERRQTLEDKVQKLKERQERFGLPEDAQKLNQRLERFDMKASDYLKEAAECDGQEDLHDLEKSKKNISSIQNRIDKLENVEPPKQIDKDAQIIPDTLYLYGTDYMSTKEIYEYLYSFPDANVKWINDSSCTVKLSSEEKANRLYEAYTVDKQPLAIDTQSTSTCEDRNLDPKIGWRQALSYKSEKMGWQNLWIRFATNLDVKSDDTKGQNSRFYKYSIANKQRDYQRGGSRHHYSQRNEGKVSSFRNKGIGGRDDDRHGGRDHRHRDQNRNRFSKIDHRNERNKKKQQSKYRDQEEHQDQNENNQQIQSSEVDAQQQTIQQENQVQVDQIQQQQIQQPLQTEGGQEDVEMN